MSTKLTTELEKRTKEKGADKASTDAIRINDPMKDTRPYFVKYNMITHDENEELTKLEAELRGLHAYTIKTPADKAKVRRCLQLRNQIDQEYCRLLMLGEEPTPSFPVKIPEEKSEVKTTSE